MLFEQIYGRGDGRLYTEEQMKRMREARWGADTNGPRDLFGEDYTEKFNTELTADEEAQYQTWAKEQGREKDVYDYDLRGAWKELQSGDMGEDARGHLGDKYKKPNHPTFSAESIYSGQDGVAGGVWSQNAEGKDVYTPGRKLSSVEADRLKRYFARVEPDAVLDLTDRRLEERALPGVTQPLGFFDGMGNAWKGVPASVLQAASSAITLGKNSLADVLANVGNDETRRWWRSQQAIMDINARDIRAYNKAHFDADPETMGTASQIVHGLIKTLPKALGYGMGFGVAGGAIAFGADVGIDETNRLMDEGVDRGTAINAGLQSFAWNAIGMRLPAVLGATRVASAAYGAGVNAGTNIAEVEGIKFILQHENYDELAKQYDLDAANLFVSATMGAAFGSVFWRSPAQIRADKYNAARDRLAHEYNAPLLKLSQAGAFDAGLKAGDNIAEHRTRAAWTQAYLNARAVVSQAQVLGIDPDKIDARLTPWDAAANRVRRLFGKEEKKADRYAPSVVLTEEGAALSGGEFHMQGPQERLDLLNRSRAFDKELERWSKGEGDASFDMGQPSWVLQLFGTGKDKNVSAEKNQFFHVLFPAGTKIEVDGQELIGSHNFSPEELRGLVAGIQRPLAVFKSGRPLKKNGQSIILLTELKRKTKGGEKNVIVPLLLTQDTRSQRLVLNKVLSAYEKNQVKPDWFKQGRLLGVEKTKGLEVVRSLHASLDSKAVENRFPQVHGSISSAADSSRPADGGPTPSTPVVGEEVKLPDGVILYENDTSVGDLYQIIGPKGTRQLDAANGNQALEAGRVAAQKMAAEGRTPQEIRMATGWEQGADGKWRYEIPDLKFKPDAFEFLKLREAEIEADKNKAREAALARGGSEDDAETAELLEGQSRQYEVVKKPLGDLVDAPELFAAYPFLRTLTVEFGDLPYGVGAYFSPSENSIRLRIKEAQTGDADNPFLHRDLIHEIQHAIQEQEGFARGTSPSAMPGEGTALYRDTEKLRQLMAANKAWQEYRETRDGLWRFWDPEEAEIEWRRERGITEADDAAEEARLEARKAELEKMPEVQAVLAEQERLRKKWGENSDVNEAIEQGYDDLDHPVYRRMDNRSDSYRLEQYYRAAGEVEARNAANRREYTVGRRRGTLLRDTEDRPREVQITTDPLGRAYSIGAENVGVQPVGGEFYQVAYHGSPHVFSKFTLDHIGTGEGMQAHGWGLYFALNQETARKYQQQLSHRFFLPDEFERYADCRKRKGELRAELESLNRDMEQVRADAAKNPEEAAELPENEKFFKEETDRLQAELKEVDAQLAEFERAEGRLYTVDIPEDNVMLREEDKVSDQPEAVQTALKKAHREALKQYEDSLGIQLNRALYGLDPEATGGETYRQIERYVRGDKEASLLLNKYGIKGIRYEGRADGECAVVWDEPSINMLEFLQRQLGEEGEGGIRGSFNPAENTIKLTPNANLSTFSHEHSHWYLANLLAHAGDENLSAEAKGDIAAILHAFNLKSVDEWNALSFEEKARRQEQYAAWTELYLAEGKIPDTCPKYLVGFFKRFGEWLMAMYRDLMGDGAGDNAAAQEVGARYKAQFDEDLPAISPEVRKVLDRMYGVEKKAMNFRPKGPVKFAARVIQSQRANNDKITAPLQEGGAPDAYTAAIRAQKAAATAMNTGEQVDVEQAMRHVPVNNQAVQQAQNSFARAFQMGDTGTIVVLQNRDRTGAVSVGQMNAIATAPDYTRLSVSRTTDSGAPIVSFGSLPDAQHQGRTEIVADSNGDKIPMTYAVVEADSVLRSNNFDGTPVAAYGADPSQVHAVAGNGRMAGLAEAYNRGTAEQYRQDLMADAQSVGVDPAVVQGMQKPVLVRFMPPEKVTTGFIERSNSSNVMEKSALETAVQDSPRVRGNVWKYQFDEDGNPTPETLGQFLADIGEPNALGKLITADGRPTETALNRIRAAVFYEAYRDRTLTALVADDTDKQGIKRILNAMAAFAPHVINIREASNGAIDLGPVLVDVVNRIRNAKIEGQPIESILGQGDMFGDNPAVQQVLGLFAENQNSAAGIARVLQPFAESLENRLRSSGNGPQAGLFGEAENVTTDMADAMGLLRDAQNRVIEEANAALREKGVTEGLREALPAVDVNAVRGTLQAIAEAQKTAEKLAEAVVETVAPEAAPVREAAPEAPADVPPDATLEAEAQAAAAHQAHERELFADNPDRTQVESLAEVNPDQVYTWMDDDGQVQAMTAKELLESDAAIDAQAETDMAGMATAAMCIIRNQGITE